MLGQRMCRMNYLNQIKRYEAWKGCSKKGQLEKDESETIQRKNEQIKSYLVGTRNEGERGIRITYMYI